MPPLFLEQDHERDQRHQRHAHDAQRQLNDHQPPAARGAVRAVMEAESPRIGCAANLMPRKEIERRTAMAQADLLPLRQLIVPAAASANACAAGTSTLTRIERMAAAAIVMPIAYATAPNDDPYGEIAGEQKDLRSAARIAASRRAPTGADGAVRPASPTAASSQSSSPSTSRGTSWRGRAATAGPCSSTPSTSTSRPASAWPTTCRWRCRWCRPRPRSWRCRNDESAHIALS